MQCKNLSSQGLFVQDYLFSFSALVQIGIIITDAVTLLVPQAEIWLIPLSSSSNPQPHCQYRDAKCCSETAACLLHFKMYQLYSTACMSTNYPVTERRIVDQLSVLEGWDWGKEKDKQTEQEPNSAEVVCSSSQRQKGEKR